MRFIFIDEVEQQQKKLDFFGVASLVVDSSHYPALRKGVDSALDKAKWNRAAGFKGRYIFSSTLGDKNVSVDDRIEIVKSIVSTTTARANARARLCFAYNANGKTPENYLGLVQAVLQKCQKAKNQKGDRGLACVYLDTLNELSPTGIEKAIVPILAKRSVRLVETPVLLPSSNSTAGLVAADVLAYLSSWDVLFPQPTEAEQASLFETEAQKLNAAKLKTSRDILQLVKQVQVFKA